MVGAAREWAGRYVALFNPTEKRRKVGIDLHELGMSGTVAVRDLWSGRSVGTANVRFERDIPPHGAELLRVA